MRREWTPEELIACWTLVEADWDVVGNKAGATRLGFALLLAEEAVRPFADPARPGVSGARLPSVPADHGRHTGGRGIVKPATDDQRLVDQAHRLRAEAHRLLHEDGLLRLVSAVGPAAVVGSFALDLMTWPDLDINVQLPHERDVAALLGLGTRIATGFRVRNLAFWNHYVRPDGPYHDGLYAGSRLLVGDREWKIDLWGFGEAAFRARTQASEALRRRLEGADRLAILRVKDAVCRRPEYRSAVSSLDVYEAVAGDGVRTVAQFDEWLRTRRVATP